MIAIPVGMAGSSIDVRTTRNAPFSSHSNEACPCRTLPGNIGCRPTVDQSPTIGASRSRAGLDFAVGIGFAGSGGMKLNHIDLQVSNVTKAREFFEQHFGLRCTFQRREQLAILDD